VAKDYDPPMHSAEHILNQTMVRMFHCGRSLNAHIEKKKSRLDYRFNRDLTPVEIAEIERRINEVIQQDLPVREEFYSRAEAEAQFNLSKLPETAGERIRIIRIGDYDTCPCMGPHVSSTREIGTFQIVSSSYESGILRMRIKLKREQPVTASGSSI
jgi:misacylated tRNA(Ala) deacylase